LLSACNDRRRAQSVAIGNRVALECSLLIIVGAVFIGLAIATAADAMYGILEFSFRVPRNLGFVFASAFGIVGLGALVTGSLEFWVAIQRDRKTRR
jgi:hypothetical protein